MMDVASLKKGPKMTLKHEKFTRRINVLQKGVLAKFSTNDATRSEQSDSRSP